MKKSDKIIDKIKEEKISPIPKWYFETKNISIWILWLISILIGSIAFSVILFSIQQTEFNLVSHISHSGLELFLALIPFFWIIALIIVLFIAVFSFQKSKKGYKFSWPRLVAISAALSILFGTLFFISGGGRWLESIFAEQVEIYESIQEKKKKIWMNPEDGFLSGSIDKVAGDMIHLIDFNNKTWKIDYENAFTAPSVTLESGEQIKIIGEKIDNDNFQATEIKPWGGKGFGRSKKMKQLEE